MDIIFQTFMFILLGHLSVTIVGNKIQPNLLKTLKFQKTANIVISMKEDSKQILEFIHDKTFETREYQINDIVTSLRNLSEDSQSTVQLFLESNSVSYNSYWISNQIFIKNAPMDLVIKLENLEDIGEISEEFVVKIDKDLKSRAGNLSRDVPEGLIWGIDRIGARQAWVATRGEGVVIGGIDTGVRATHEALMGNFRQDYGWFDAVAGQQIPYDDQGHGTHTMGTIVGTNDIGVAPEAHWVACKACGLEGCTQEALTNCGQWMLCPTRPDGSQPDCEKAPQIVSNSWGNKISNSAFAGVTKAWVAAGIIPVFAAGNDGQLGCSTVGSPADYNDVITVGATDYQNYLAYFSSQGPTHDGRIKPDVSAPGKDIYSASHVADTAYKSDSGTSMACPHIAGAVALMISRTRRMTFKQVLNVLTETADNVGYLTPPLLYCGGVPDNIYPNNAFGYGRVNVLKALNARSSAGRFTLEVLQISFGLVCIMFMQTLF